MIRDSVYLAASSADMARAQHWHEQLTAAGVNVISTWIENVLRVGAANPRGASHQDRRAWALRCLAEVREAVVVWLLVPPAPHATFGGGVECGYALCAGADLICSGDTHQSIFAALAEEHGRDEDAFASVLALLGSKAMR